MPSVAGPWTMRKNPPCLPLAKLLTPLADGFISDYDAAPGHHRFYIAVTQGESKIPQTPVADDLGGETVLLYGLAGKTQGAAFIASSNHDDGKLTIPHAPFALDQLQFGQAQQKAV
jgi:hypothetical protein